MCFKRGENTRHLNNQVERAQRQNLGNYSKKDNEFETWAYDAFVTSMPISRTTCFWGLFHYPNCSKWPKSAHIPSPVLTSYRMAKLLLKRTKFQHPMGLKEPKKQVL